MTTESDSTVASIWELLRFPPRIIDVLSETDSHVTQDTDLDSVTEDYAVSDVPGEADVDEVADGVEHLQFGN